jgi:hypothetical protein
MIKPYNTLMYILELNTWPSFRFNGERITTLLETCHFEQGRLLGRMEMLEEKRVLDTIVSDVVKSSELEGYQLNAEQVRSSIAHRLDIPLSDSISSTRNVDRLVEMMIDAIQNYEKPLTEDRLYGWHSCLFPSGYSGMAKILVGQYRKKHGCDFRFKGKGKSTF